MANWPVLPPTLVGMALNLTLGVSQPQQVAEGAQRAASELSWLFTLSPKEVENDPWRHSRGCPFGDPAGYKSGHGLPPACADGLVLSAAPLAPAPLVHLSDGRDYVLSLHLEASDAASSNAATSPADPTASKSEVSFPEYAITSATLVASLVPAECSAEEAGLTQAPATRPGDAGGLQCSAACRALPAVDEALAEAPLPWPAPERSVPQPAPLPEPGAPAPLPAPLPAPEQAPLPLPAPEQPLPQSAPELPQPAPAPGPSPAGLLPSDVVSAFAPDTFGDADDAVDLAVAMLGFAGAPKPAPLTFSAEENLPAFSFGSDFGSDRPDETLASKSKKPKASPVSAPTAAPAFGFIAPTLPPPQLSCEGRCEEQIGPASGEQPTCACDATCVLRGDCCADAWQCMLGPTAPPNALSPTLSPTSTLAPTRQPRISSPSPTKSPTAGGKRPSPTLSPTKSPTAGDTSPSPTLSPTKSPTAPTRRRADKGGTPSPTKSPTKSPMESPTKSPTTSPRRGPPTPSPSADRGRIVAGACPTEVLSVFPTAWCPGGCSHCTRFPGVTCYCDSECEKAGDCCCSACAGKSEDDMFLGHCPGG